jgi:tetratricopeptide (TPR) repeat protein
VADGIVQHRLDPASSLASSALGRAQYRARQFEAAMGALSKVIALDRTYAPNYARLADVYLALGRYDDALHCLDEGQKVAGGTRRQTDGYGLA